MRVIGAELAIAGVGGVAVRLGEVQLVAVEEAEGARLRPPCAAWPSGTSGSLARWTSPPTPPVGAFSWHVWPHLIWQRN